jgi:hypothetical protein
VVHYVDLPVYGTPMSLAWKEHRMRCVTVGCRLEVHNIFQQGQMYEEIDAEAKDDATAAEVAIKSLAD